MNGWLEPVIPHLKALHISMLLVWCAGVIALPLMLAYHDPVTSQSEYRQIRHYTHFAYTFGVTPAAVLAVASGTLLLFVRDLFVPWMFLKFLFVSGLAVSHAWVGHTIVAMATKPESHRPPHPILPAALALAPIVAILFLVLAKPDLGWIQFPDWLTEPLGRGLPFDVPSQ